MYNRGGAEMGKAAARAAMSNLARCWWMPSQMNWVLVELSRSQLDDIQTSRAHVIEFINPSGRSSIRGRAMQVGLDIICI